MRAAMGEVPHSYAASAGLKVNGYFRATRVLLIMNIIVIR